MANDNGNKKPRRRVMGEKRRVNLKLDEELAEWAFEYAERHNTSVTQLITDHLMDLQRHEAELLARDAEQI
jgi:hypothetical protein